jgi:alpha-L-rhamnosidase
MNRRELILVVGASAVGTTMPLLSAVAAGDDRSRWAARAQSLLPQLHETEQSPLTLVRAVAAADLPLRFRMETDAPATDLARRVLRKGDSVIVDFGGHRTGYLSFRLETEGREPDAPARLRFTFGEVPTDVAEPLYPYQGELSQAWLPDEIVNIDYLPQSVRLSRRYAFRYVKIEVVDTSPGFGVRFESLRAHAVTSARVVPPALATGTPLLKRIDEVAVATLRDCMQTTFEDGPRRDQRLWIGDLRLQALTTTRPFARTTWCGAACICSPPFRAMTGWSPHASMKNRRHGMADCTSSTTRPCST